MLIGNDGAAASTVQGFDKRIRRAFRRSRKAGRVWGVLRFFKRDTRTLGSSTGELSGGSYERDP